MTTFLTPVFVIFFEGIKYGKILLLILVIGAVTMTSVYFKPQEFLGRKDDYYANRYIPTPFASKEYRSLQEEYLRLPKITQKRPEQNGKYIKRSDGGILYINDLNLSNDFQITMTTYDKKPFTLEYEKYYFPGWQARVDGNLVPITPGNPYGQITLKVPTGNHKVAIFFEETPFKKLLDLTSLVSLLVLFILLWRSKISTKS